MKKVYVIIILYQYLNDRLSLSSFPLIDNAKIEFDFSIDLTIEKTFSIENRNTPQTPINKGEAGK